MKKALRQKIRVAITTNSIAGRGNDASFSTLRVYIADIVNMTVNLC